MDRFIYLEVDGRKHCFEQVQRPKDNGCKDCWFFTDCDRECPEDHEHLCLLGPTSKHVTILQERQERVFAVSAITPLNSNVDNVYFVVLAVDHAHARQKARAHVKEVQHLLEALPKGLRWYCELMPFSDNGVCIG